ncbi:hypothetical protein EXIGLDRAFT_719842 [Exidia glandulosa HHB12029]|uniref:Carboxypeptidase n=1 Tax=Exidia glandulosa HHB12029 TaxID=1314781 RepID=A0A165GRG3_EXIGL|nr:hypothetical protein EXIGLDRAFT_719842 [Exidia glandulosa HHB12029]
MKVHRFATLALAPTALALPSPWLQEVRNVLSVLAPDSVLTRLGLEWTAHQLDVSTEAQKVLNDVKTWWKHGKEFVQRGQNIYERILSRNAQLNDYALRLTATHDGDLSSPSICDSGVKQHSGYLDISDDRHLFFWFFESRNDPANAPLMLWLNGGPGCSSSTGLLLELGPCKVTEGGLNTTSNPHSWTNNFNMIFLDQPVDVGYSYRTGGGSVSTTPVAAVDVWAFLQLFLARFPQYANTPFHLAAESYGGTYAPHIASVIHKRNAERGQQGLVHIPLESIVLANGLTEPRTQMGSVPDMACDGPFEVFDPESQECASLRSKAPTCQRLIQNCYNSGSRFVCVPAGLYCWSQLFSAFNELGLNPYDVREKCDRSKNSLCYSGLDDIDVWLNRAEVKSALGAEEGLTFQGCNMEVNRAFMLQGDGMHNSAALLPELLAAGVRLLVYAGNADFMCNFIGNERWMESLEGHPFASQFAQTEKTEWRTLQSDKVVGKVRAAGGDGAGNFTFVEVHDAGHMVPYNQPEAALDMIERWVFDFPLTE